MFHIERDQYDLPVYKQLMDGYEKLYHEITAGRVISAYAVEGHGLAESVAKMAFGNKLGVKIEHNVDPRDFFAPDWGSIVCEVPDGKVSELSISYTVIGEVTQHGHHHGRGAERMDRDAGKCVPDQIGCCRYACDGSALRYKGHLCLQE